MMPYLMTYGGGRYTSVAWFCAPADAERERLRILRSGAWSGMPPKVEPDAELGEKSADTPERA